MNENENRFMWLGQGLPWGTANAYASRNTNYSYTLGDNSGLLKASDGLIFGSRAAAEEVMFKTAKRYGLNLLNTEGSHYRTYRFNKHVHFYINRLDQVN